MDFQWAGKTLIFNIRTRREPNKKGYREEEGNSSSVYRSTGHHTTFNTSRQRSNPFAAVATLHRPIK